MELDKEFLNDRQSEEEYLDCVRIGRNCKKSMVTKLVTYGK